MTGPWDETFEQVLRPLLPLLPAQQPITADLDLVGAGLDSLRVVELLAEVEDRYDIALADEEIAQQTVESPGSLWRVVQAHLADR